LQCIRIAIQMGKKTQKQEQNKTKRNANTHSFTPYPKSMVTHNTIPKEKYYTKKFKFLNTSKL
jgi:hypothetical protein